jgi:hypothetical protein
MNIPAEKAPTPKISQPQARIASLASKVTKKIDMPKSTVPHKTAHPMTHLNKHLDKETLLL